MAEKELRRMNRTELIEIIYALQQDEQELTRKNEELEQELDDKLLRIEQSGSIADAALSLNHIFEDAQNAADQYLSSLQNANAMADDILNDAKDQAKEILASAAAEKQRAKELLLKAQQVYDQCRQERAEVDQFRTSVIQQISDILSRSPELAAKVLGNNNTGGR